MEPAQKRVIYEDFEPSTEWLHDPALHTLQVYIPGYAKEQVKVQVTSTRKLRVNGERPIKDNRVSRFRKEFQIQSDVDINKIAANFTGGTLYVKLPKYAPATIPPERQVTVKPPQPKTIPKPQALPVPPQQAAQKKQEEEEEAIPPKTTVEKQSSVNKTNETITGGDKETQTSKPEVRANEIIEKIPEKTQVTAGNAGEVVAKTNSKKDATNDNACKSKINRYKKTISGLAVEFKRPKKLMSLLLVASVVAVLAFYVQNQIRTGTNSDN